jgi:predicted molibdopterin-dependent oxidoreductase YjgC
MIRAADEGRLKALYLAGADPSSFVPGGARVTEALGKLDFLVVQDLFLTEAAGKADVVLPAAAAAEKEGTFTSIERRVQKINQAVPEPGEALADWKVFTRIGEALGIPGMGNATPDGILREISDAVSYYSGIDGSLGDGGVQWPVTDGGTGTARLLEDGVPGDRNRFSAVQGWSTWSPDAQYPFALVVGDLLCHSGSYTRYSENLNKVHSSAFLLIHPATAAESGVADGDTARVSSSSGEINVPVQFSTDLIPGALFLARHFADARVSGLMDTGAGEGPSRSVINVKVERA